MRLNLVEDKFHIRAYFASCACQCEFCCLGDYPKNKQISFDDYEKAMLKFQNISETNGMRLRSFIYNCPNHKYLKRQIQLYDSLPMVREEYTQLDNGTTVKEGKVLESWFDELVDSGVESVAFSWFGDRDIHDAFVHREGYYDYLRNCTTEARQHGLPVISKVFLHKRILPQLEEVIRTVNSFSSRTILAFMEYSGKAKFIQNEFLTEDDLKSNPIISNNMSETYRLKFKTEKDWKESALNNTFPEFKIVDYILYLDADNIEYVLSTPNELIIEDFRRMNKTFMDSFLDIKAIPTT